ncbi:hypothetical protein YSY43_01830 [Paenibacillus sp. YSY-4.3]
MKVLFTFIVPSGGMETLNRLRCEALREVAIKGHLLYSNAGSGLQNIKDIPTYISPTDDELYKILRMFQYDAIITTSDFLMPQKLRKLNYNGPIIFEAQGLGTMISARRTLKDGASILEANCQGALLPPTPHLVQLITDFCPALPKYIFPNLLDTVKFRYRPQTVPSKPVIAWVGRLEKNKNWKLFLKIAQSLVNIKNELSFWVFHDDKLCSKEMLDLFWEKVHSYGLHDHIKVYANAPHSTMPDYLSRVGDSGGFLLSTSVLEGFGYAVAEAIACRCPVLSTDSEGVRFFIRHNETGKFFERNNMDNAVHQALELMDNLQLRKQIRNRGAEYVSNLMSPQQYAANFHNMLLNLKAKQG